jgi:hypothetical protein
MNWSRSLPQINPAPTHDRKEWWIMYVALCFIEVEGCGAEENRIIITTSITLYRNLLARMYEWWIADFSRRVGE